MAGRDDVGMLLSIMPNDHGTDELVDWAAVEAHLGTSLPSDYRTFMAVYGGGSIENLDILSPLATGNGWAGSISDLTVTLRHLWELGWWCSWGFAGLRPDSVVGNGV